jgi:hypothetical protein
LRLDYEKTYDKANWPFLLEILEKRGFGQRWLGWIKSTLFRGSWGNSKQSVGRILPYKKRFEAG